MRHRMPWALTHGGCGLSGIKAVYPQGSHTHVPLGGPDEPRGLGVIELQVLPHSCRCCLIKIVCIDPPHAIHLQEELTTHRSEEQCV